MGKIKSSRISFKFILTLAGLGAIFLACFFISSAKTSTTDFCISCHEMKIYKDELKVSIHAVDKDKKPIECKDCHIPKGYGGKHIIVKTVLSIKDVWIHNFGEPENLNRQKMQKFARRFIPDENCRACHKDLTKDTNDKELSEIGKLCHEAYLGENGETRSGCAGCHFNMAHLPSFDRRYNFNSKFVKKLSLWEEKK